MTNLADIFPFTLPVTSPSYPAHVGTTAPTSPTVGNIWFNPNTSVVMVYTAAGWMQVAGSAGGTTPGASRIVDLTDVDAFGALDSDILVYNGLTNMWEAVALDLDYGRY